MYTQAPRRQRKRLLGCRPFAYPVMRLTQITTSKNNALYLFQLNAANMLKNNTDSLIYEYFERNNAEKDIATKDNFLVVWYFLILQQTIESYRLSKNLLVCASSTDRLPCIGGYYYALYNLFFAYRTCLMCAKKGCLRHKT